MAPPCTAGRGADNSVLRPVRLDLRSRRQMGARRDPARVPPPLSRDRRQNALWARRAGGLPGAAGGIFYLAAAAVAVGFSVSRPKPVTTLSVDTGHRMGAAN